MRTLSLSVVLLLASMASAIVVEDFEGAYAGPGALVADPEDAGNTVLHLAEVPGSILAEVFEVAAPDTTGVVTMRIYDFGANTEKVDSRYGPRWGLRGDGGVFTSALHILYKSWISGYKGYLFNQTQSATMTPTSTVSSPNWFSGDTAGRYVTALDDIATTGLDESQGAWATWTFEVAPDATVTVTAEANGVVDAAGVYHDGPVTATGPIESVGQLTGIFVSAGTNAALPDGVLKFVGVLVDDVTWGPYVAGKPGDADGDGDVDLDDFVILKSNFGADPLTDDRPDFDDDGDVDLDDFVILKTNFGVTPPANGDADGDGDVDLDDFVILKTNFGT